jgi:hypothetical protein
MIHKVEVEALEQSHMDRCSPVIDGDEIAVDPQNGPGGLGDIARAGVGPSDIRN